MFEDNVEIIDAKNQNEDILNICKQLWENNFDDSIEYVRYYFTDRWKESCTLLYKNESMVHLNPYNINLFGSRRIIYYIVGVCTNMASRHKGYMDILLKKTFEKLYNENAPFVYLMPAKEKIYLPYDFRGIYKIRTCNVIKTREETESSDLKCHMELFGKLSDIQKNELAEYAYKKLRVEFDCYVTRDVKYFYHKDLEMRACGGAVLVFFSNGRVVGYAMYINEDGPEVTEIVVDDEYAEVIIGKLIKYSDLSGSSDGLSQKLICDETYFIKGQNDGFAFFISEQNIKNLLMARIIDIESFIKMINWKNKIEEYHIEIEDNFIEGNNGKWDIILQEKSIAVKTENCSQIYQKMTIAEFEDMILPKIRFFLNEMV